MQATPETLVKRFYHEVWNQADERVAREILDSEFRFRASLGPERRGPEGFIEYMRSIHAALANYTCTIVDLVTAENRAAARMTFKGIHRARFLRWRRRDARSPGQAALSSRWRTARLPSFGCWAISIASNSNSARSPTRISRRARSVCRTRY